MSKKCAKCLKTVYPTEELKCLDKVSGPSLADSGFGMNTPASHTRSTRGLVTPTSSRHL